jgi:predicted methyltransferase
MGNIEGKRVADVAAGQGYLTRPLSRKVGAAGRVYAVEIGEVERRALEKLAKDSFPNIEVIAGTETDPKLPDAIDAVVVLNSYHEFTQYRAMLDGFKRALRPGGLLVLVDNDAFANDQTRDWQASHHGLNPRFVDEELRAAGFEIADRQDKFIVQPFPQWLFVARRPLK